MKTVKWNNISITKKIFIITLFAIVLLLSLFLIVQGLLYGKIYEYTKEQALKDIVTGFAEEYSHLNDKSEINKKISEYSAKNNVYIMVGDNHGIKYAVSYEMTVEAENGETMRFMLDNAVKSKDFLDLSISEGDTLTVSFMQFNKGNADFYVPDKISAKSGEWKNNQPMDRRFMDPKGSDDNKSLENTHGSVTGKVISIITPIVENDIIQRSDALGALMSFINNGHYDESDKISFYKYENPDTKDNYKIVFKPIDNNQFIFGVVSLRHIDEAVSILQNMIIPWIIIAGFIALAVGFGFTKIITRPIVSLTKITTKMKNLDFSEHCAVSGRDEVGILANNINEMSDKLDLTIKELVYANDKLKEDINHERMLERQRKDFVAAVSHELKTPLAIIRAYAEGLIDGVSENKRLKYMNVIVDETKKMDRLVLDMLENSKLEAGIEKLNLRPYSLSKIIEKYVKLFEENFKQKKITVNVNNSGECTTNLDCDKIEQVISNFLSNALKNTPENGIVNISLVENEASIRVTVGNTGNHISDEELEKVWDKFYKCDKSRERRDNGTGLGLSIAKNILILHNADYGVNNTENGVEFFFELKKQ